MYFNVSVFTKLTLRRKLLSLKFNKIVKLEDRFQKIDQVVREIENIDTNTMTDEDKICYLLLSLNDDYEYVITATETLTTDINLEFVKARLLDEEIKLNNKTTDVSFKANTYNQNSTYILIIRDVASIL